MLELFAKELIASKLLDQQQVVQAVHAAEEADLPLIVYLSENKIMPDNKLAAFFSEFFALPLYDLSVHDKNAFPKDTPAFKAVEKGWALPIYLKNNNFVVAVVDPTIKELQNSATDVSDIHQYAFTKGLKLCYVLVAPNVLKTFTTEHLIDNPSPALDMLSDVGLDDLEISTYSEESEENDLESFDEDDAPVVRFVNRILVDAINLKASDIHFEPYEKTYRIRYRQDGILREVATPPVRLAPSMVARIKVMSNLDISERRVPQDGRFKLSLGKDKAIDFRVSVCPTLHGEKVVMRLLDSTGSTLDIDYLGMEDFQKKIYLDCISNAQGMILVTGPTGSGKTVSLYTALGILNTTDRNISTIEDPVEIYMQGINQVQVNNKAGLTFSEALRAFLRQDPDVMMVGEIRDLETAEIGIKAAQTGHLVLSTLHTNNAPVTIERLLNMGVKAYNIASSVILVVAQRLVRRLCERCRERETLPRQVLLDEGFKEDELDLIEIYKAVGCQHCTEGYKGRAGIYEIMPLSKAMRELILQNSSALELTKQARKEEILDMRQSGLLKVKSGITSLKEINRVVGY